eukprot:3191162-Pyramimonas_sp.AAC.1
MRSRKHRFIPTTNQSDAGSTGIFSRRTNQMQEAGRRRVRELRKVWNKCVRSPPQCLSALPFGDVAPARAGGFPGSAGGFPTLPLSYVSVLPCLRIFRRSYALLRRWFQKLAATLVPCRCVGCVTGCKVTFSVPVTSVLLITANCGFSASASLNSNCKRTRHAHPSPNDTILSPLLQLVPAVGIFSFPFRDWCPLRLYFISLPRLVPAAGICVCRVVTSPRALALRVAMAAQSHVLRFCETT